MFNLHTRGLLLALARTVSRRPRQTNGSELNNIKLGHGCVVIEQKSYATVFHRSSDEGLINL